jgi:hypothetical protein
MRSFVTSGTSCFVAAPRALNVSLMWSAAAD